MVVNYIVSGSKHSNPAFIVEVANVFQDEPYLLIDGGERCDILFQAAWWLLWMEYQGGEG